MLSVLALGIVIASTLLAAAPIYARTMGDLGLTFVVREDLESTSATRILLRDAEIGTSDGQALSDAIDARIDERAGWFTGSIARYELGARFTIVGETEIEPVFGQPYLELQAFEGYEEHVSIDEGRLPARSAPGAPIEVAISAEGAEAADLALGDTVVLSERLDDCEQEIVEGEMPVVTPCPPGTPTVELLYQLQATVVAIVSPLDDESPAWPGGANAFFAPRRAIPGAPRFPRSPIPRPSRSTSALPSPAIAPISAGASMSILRRFPARTTAAHSRISKPSAMTFSRLVRSPSAHSLTRSPNSSAAKA